MKSFSNHACVHIFQSTFLIPVTALFPGLVVVLWLQDHLIQNLCLQVGLLTQQRLRLPDQMVGLETDGGRKEGWIHRKTDKKIERRTDRH